MIGYGLGVFLTGEIPAEAYRWRNDPAIIRWCRQYTLLHPAEQEKWEGSIGLDPHNKMFGIKVKSIDGMASEFISVGVCGLTNISWIARHAEFSLYIAPEYQSMGFGKRTLYTLCKHGFEDFNLNKIWGESFDGNPSIKMFESLGFKIGPGHTQHYFKEGRYLNTYFAVMMREDWEKDGKDRCRDFGKPPREIGASEGLNLAC